MKPVDGKNLQGYIQTLKSDADKNFQERVDIFSKICDAIAYAHAQNIIHPDLNRRISTRGIGEVLVGDWGLAKQLQNDSQDLDILDLEIQNNKTLHGVIKGTPGYMAPEQIHKGLGI